MCLKQTFLPSVCIIQRWRLGEYIHLQREFEKEKDDGNSVKNKLQFAEEFHLKDEIPLQTGACLFVLVRLEYFQICGTTLRLLAYRVSLSLSKHVWAKWPPGKGYGSHNRWKSTLPSDRPFVFRRGSRSRPVQPLPPDFQVPWTKGFCWPVPIVYMLTCLSLKKYYIFFILWFPV